LKAKEEDMKSINYLLSKYSYSSLAVDMKKLIIRQKIANQLTWNEIEGFHGIDRRSLLPKPKK
jgi:hypothetical protein